jgi:hypothetical protein
MVKLKREQKRKVRVSNFHIIVKFDNIITNDYMTTYFDTSVVLKLYSDMEFFIKGLLYQNIDAIYKALPPFSEEYDFMFGLKGQKNDFN